MRKVVVIGMVLVASCQYTPDFRMREQPAVHYHAPEPVEAPAVEKSDTPIEEDMD